MVVDQLNSTTSDNMTKDVRSRKESLRLWEDSVREPAQAGFRENFPGEAEGGMGWNELG